ncbi:MAG: hypothetical protein EXR52_07680 [Dehalococcoidia bacterium]|nr:hypothetical protein [Dehalococcoidia bacterium]
MALAILILSMQLALPARAAATAHDCQWGGLWDIRRDDTPAILRLLWTSYKQSHFGIGEWGPDARRLGGSYFVSGDPPTTDRSRLTGGWADVRELRFSVAFDIQASTDCGSFAGVWTKDYPEQPYRHGTMTGTRITADDRTLMVIDAYRCNLCRDPETAGRLY